MEEQCHNRARDGDSSGMALQLEGGVFHRYRKAHRMFITYAE
jgi:hypothetical protein